jgi:pyruvate/2-oxoglutarate dehydrogenase complex dihydrolipoamide dehydrogenase (E3) component
MSEAFDVICLGAGPAGEAIGVELEGSGLSLAVIERHLVGGECPYWGCIPSKTLLRSAETLSEAERARELAVSRVDFEVDYPKIHKRTMWMVRELDDSGAAKAIEDQGHTVIRGEGRLTGPRQVSVDGRELTANKAVVIATGTEPVVARIPGIEEVGAWTTREAVLADELPERLVVIGAGPAGVEISQAFLRFGSKVDLFESAARVLALEEPEAGDYVQKKLVEEGLEVHCSSNVVKLDVEGGEIHVHCTDGNTVACDKILVTTGRKPNSDTLDLEAAGLSADARGWIQVDPETLAAADGIYAVGDINGLGGFTHLSHYHGTVVGRRLRGEDVRANHAAIPRVTYTDPEVGSIGLTEAQAKEKGINVRIGSAEVANSARGAIAGEPGGLIKVVVDADSKLIVGATLVGPRSGEMLTEFTLAMRAGVPMPVLADTMHAFPTFARILQGVFDSLNRGLA